MKVVIEQSDSSIEVMTEEEFEKMKDELDEFDGIHPYIFKGWLSDSRPVEGVVKKAACGKWQRKKPNKPCYFLHRYNKKDDHPTLQMAYIDTDVLCVANVQDDEFVETMEGFADGQFYIIEK